MTRTKIVCTIGPTSERVSILEHMLKSGMNVARLALSHGNYQNHKTLLKHLRQAEKKQVQTWIPLVMDLQGPRLRLGTLPKEGIKLDKNKQVILTTQSRHEKRQGRENLLSLPISSTAIFYLVRKNDLVLMSDGFIQLKVEKIRPYEVWCVIKQAGQVFSHKGINIPHRAFLSPILSQKDKNDILFSLKLGAEYLALSYVRDARDILAVKRFLKKHIQQNMASPLLIAKIEHSMALEHLDEIIALVDAVMVARGDLALQTHFEQVPMFQKDIVARCVSAGKPVIVATQMLESMTNAPVPTRAEASDVANAVMDHTDAVMLSGESAMGKYPVQVVQMMSKILQATELSVYDDFNFQKNIFQRFLPQDLEAALKQRDFSAMILLARSFSWVAQISVRRLEKPIIALTTSKFLARQLSLCWGIIPVFITSFHHSEKFLMRFLEQKGFLRHMTIKQILFYAES